MLQLDALPSIWSAWRNRYADRDERHDTILKVIDDDYDISDSDEDELPVVSPNFIKVGIEDTAEAASLVPTVRGVPHRPTNTAKASAAAMEQIATHYMRANAVDILIPETVGSMAAFGLGVWVVEPDFEAKIPIVRRRDAWQCYPEPGWRPGQQVRRCLFTRDLYLSQLPDEWRDKVVEVDGVGPSNGMSHDYWLHNTKVTLVEWYDEHEYVTAAIYETGTQQFSAGVRTGVTSIPVELERIENRIGRCPVVLGARLTIDGEQRGQFDQAVGGQRAHQRLQAAMLDFSDQSVYSDLYVKDLISEMSMGGGGYIELGPQGEIGRVPPAVPSMAAFQDLAILEDGIHLSGRWPKSRPGEISQCLAPWTKVLTEDLRWVEVGKLEVGDRIAGFDEETGGPKSPRKWETAVVTEASRTTLPSYRVTLADGTEFVASEGHKWLVRNAARVTRWVETKDLKTVDHYWHAPVVKAMDTWDDEQTYERGYLEGFFDGEGCLSRCVSARASNPDGPDQVAWILSGAQRENVVLSKVESLLALNNIDYGRHEGGGFHGDVIQLHIRGGRHKILEALGLIGSERLRQKFVDLGGFDSLGRFNVTETVDIVDVEFIGDHEVVSLGTTTGTLIAEGFAHHNSIASAKFLEASAGMMNTVIKTYHLILKDMFERTFPLMFDVDRMYFPGRKTMVGVLRNQQFLGEYDTSSIDPKNFVRVEYGLGLGRDPSQSAILHIQYAQNDYLSQEFVMENIDGLTDVAREKSRIDTQKFQEIMLGKILEGVQGGTVTSRQLIDMAKKRADGEPLMELFEEFIVKPQEQMEGAGMQGGLDPGALLGAAMPEGAVAEGPPGAAPPVPPAPAPSDLLNRLSVGAGGRSFMSSDVGG